MQCRLAIMLNRRERSGDEYEVNVKALQWSKKMTEQDHYARDHIIAAMRFRCNPAWSLIHSNIGS